jgi:NhaP-type Na+/H+ and K+/H+ antiporter
MVNVDKMAGAIVGSIAAAAVIAIMGDAFIYDPEASNQTVGFETGSSAATVINVSPVVLVALGLYAGFTYM